MAQSDAKAPAKPPARIWLMRHGIAIDRGEPGCPPEPSRYLTDEGINRTKLAVKGLKALGVKPHLIVTSSFLRAEQTAEIAADGLGVDRKNVRTSMALLPPTRPADFWHELCETGAESVLCSGHAPGLDEVIAYLVLGQAQPFTSLKKAGVACIEIVSATPPFGFLAWVATAKMLRRIGQGS